jgi:nitrate reductase assembly molybdenum cofactor insertion protein NarJ
MPTIGDRYVNATAKFDMNPASALDLGWHLFGDAPERGAFMAALRDDLERVAVRESRELPDHLTHILALLAREDEDRAVRLAHLIAPAIENVRVALAGGKSPYAHVLAAVQTLVAAIGSACETEGARP